MLLQAKNGLWKGTLINGDGSVSDGKRAHNLCACGKRPRPPHLAGLQSGHFPFTLVELVDCGAYDNDLKTMEVRFQVEMDAIYGNA